MSASRMIDENLAIAALLGRSGVVKATLAKGGASELGLEAALNVSASQGHVEVLRIILPWTPSPRARGVALIASAEAGMSACVRELIGAGDPMVEQGRALREAARQGHEEAVADLLPFCESAETFAWAAKGAREGGHDALAKKIEVCGAAQEQRAELNVALEAAPKAAELRL